jgi:hypothetical protein
MGRSILFYLSMIREFQVPNAQALTSPAGLAQEAFQVAYLLGVGASGYNTLSDNEKFWFKAEVSKSLAKVD